MERMKAGAVLIVTLAVLAIYGWQQHRIAQLRAAAAEQARQAERDALEREGALLAAEEGQHAAERLAASLREQIAAVRRVAPTARVAESARVVGRTVAARGEGRMDGSPRPVAGQSIPTGGAPGQAADETSTSSAAASPRCLLHEGDAARVDATWAALTTDAGNRVLVGEGTAVREAGGPEVVIRSPIRADLSRWLVVPPVVPVRRASWAASVEYGVAGGRAWAVGAERRVAGPVWLGLTAGADGNTARVAARLRVEW